MWTVVASLKTKPPVSSVKVFCLEAGQPVAVAIMRDEGAHIQLLDPASGNVQPAILADEYRGTDHGNAELMLVKECLSSHVQ